MGLFSKPQLGIEITPAAVRVVGITGGNKPSLLGCKEVTVAEGPAGVSQALREAVKTAAPHKISAKNAVIVVPEGELFRKIIEVPPIANPKELREAIHLEVLQYVPDTTQHLEFDYQLLGTLPENGSQQFMVVASPGQQIAAYMTSLKGAGLSTQAISTVPAALGRAVVAESEERPVVLVAVDSSACTISLYRSGTVWVSSTLNQGLAEGADAALIKRLVALIADEVDHVLKFYENRTAGSRAKAEEVRIVGKGPECQDIKEALAKILDLKVVMAKSVINVPAFCDSRYLTALGAALYHRFERL